MKKRIIDVIFGRMIFVIIMFVIQFAVLFLIVSFARDYLLQFYGLCTFISFCFVLAIVDSDISPSYKISWIVAITMIPLLGWIFYRFFTQGKAEKIRYLNIENYSEKVKRELRENPDIYEKIKKEDKRVYNDMKYILNSLHYPAFDGTSAEYFPVGEKMYAKLLEELEKAEKYIFMEYFILAEGEMLDSILSILERKAAEGVDIRIIFDDLGCLFTLPMGFRDMLEKKGIKCAVFNKVGFILTLRYNNRTHRKYTVIDGKTAFTGGINIADEYVNKIERFGHWKDSAVMLKGNGAKVFTVMFFCFWAQITGKYEEDYKPYLPDDKDDTLSESYVIPFTDTPLDNEATGEIIYINEINNATDYVYITTPYLILDNEIANALISAAKKGVDVRIITPHIPDKKAVFSVTRSNYDKLIRNGVRIYEYTPGFIHAKNFICDDKIGIVGTINLDYRSFYLHFECAVWMYKAECIKDIKDDFLKTFDISQEITKEDILKIKKAKTLYRRFLNLLAPLM